jgi:uncharacterized protein (DUF2235 family)
MKRIVLCFDGTWNKAEKEAVTNVRRIANLIHRMDQQLCWYDEGVGTGQWEKVRGAFGFGLSRNIQQGYAYLGLTYDPGDQIFLLGFSRGAYTARSLSGLIRKCGILRRSEMSDVDIRGLTDSEVQSRLNKVIEKTPVIEQAYELYRQRDGGPDTNESKAFRDAHSYPVYNSGDPSATGPEATRIRFIGVWDTVGSLGVPLKTLQWVSVFNRERYLFHDTKLSGMVEYARHAVAIDEYRADYSPTLWTPDDQWASERLRQRWFIGAHGDVGGGYDVGQPLADLALSWMVHEAQGAGLSLEPPTLSSKNYMADITRTYDSFLFGVYKWFSGRAVRPIMKLIAREKSLDYRNQDVDPSVVQRLSEDKSYHREDKGLRRLAGLS